MKRKKFGYVVFRSQNVEWMVKKVEVKAYSDLKALYIDPYSEFGTSTAIISKNFFFKEVDAMVQVVRRNRRLAYYLRREKEEALEAYNSSSAFLERVNEANLEAEAFFKTKKQKALLGKYSGEKYGLYADLYNLDPI